MLVTQRPEATTALLMQLCTRQAPGAPEGAYVTRIADVSHLYADRYCAASQPRPCCAVAAGALFAPPLIRQLPGVGPGQ